MGLIAVHDLDAAAAGRPVPPAPAEPHTPDLTDRCNYCEDRIQWVHSSNGRIMPIDDEPSPNGNVLVKNGHGGVLGKTQAAAARAFGEQLHLHHAVSCPHASSWNRGAARDEARRGGGRR